jgi:hypothetical protein
MASARGFTETELSSRSGKERLWVSDSTPTADCEYGYERTGRRCYEWQKGNMREKGYAKEMKG